MANSRMRGENMRAHDQDNMMPDAAQVQEAVVPSLKSSGIVVSGAGPESKEASGGLEDAGRLSDKSSSSNAEEIGRAHV